MKFINTVLSASLLFTLSSSQGLLAGPLAIESLTQRISELERMIEQGLSQSMPPKAIMAFYTEKCPTGWLPADGQNETPDLRGEFIRGWDRGRGVDQFYELDKETLNAKAKERHLGSWQAPTLITTAIGEDAIFQPYINGNNVNGENLENHNTALPEEFHSGIQTDSVEGNWYSKSFTGAIYVNAIQNLYVRSSHLDSKGIKLLNDPKSIRTTIEKKVEINVTHFGGTRPRNVALLYCMKE
ncbi:MAG: hypothetical protein WAT29_19870 [Thiolinea sp.]